MSKSPLSVKLACRSWQQLSAIYARDLCRNAFFLKTKKPPPIGTQVRISLTLPSDTSVEFNGSISKIVDADGLGGRGPGVDITLLKLSHSVMWLVESALSSAGMTPELSLSNGSNAKPDSTKAIGTQAPDSEMSEGSAVVDAEAELIDSLESELDSIAKWNPFQRLNLEYNTTDQAVRSAFGDLSKKYHPDRFTRYQNPKIRELAGELYLLLRDAYRHIAKEPDRVALLAKIKPSALPPTTTPAAPPTTPAALLNTAARRAAAPTKGPPPTPEVASARKVAAPTKGPPLPPTLDVNSSEPPGPKIPDLAAKVTRVGSSRRNTPGIGSEIFDNVQQSSVSPLPDNEAEDVSPKVALALRMLEGGQYEQAMQLLKIELRKNPDDLDAQVGVELAAGRLALVSGDRMEAGQRFEAALDIDPTNERAAREIAEMRRHVTSQRRGLLSKLMKKI